MDNDQLLNEIKGLLEGMEQRFDSKLATLKEELREYVYDAETSLMRAFSQWQVSGEARMKRSP
jgi:hypothetical protein